VTGFGSFCQPATVLQEEKRRFRAYLFHVCVTNGCFVPLTQWGGLSHSAGMGLRVSELTDAKI